MPDNASDRKSIRRKEKESKQHDRLRAEVITSIMATPAGRQWVWDILATCHMFHTTFNGEALQSAFMEGQRAIGLSILTDIMATTPDQYIQAMRESNERSTIDERRSSAQHDGRDSGSSDGEASDSPSSYAFDYNPGDRDSGDEADRNQTH